MARFLVLAAVPLTVLALARDARGDEAADAVALARSVVERHRSDAHRSRFEVLLPEPRPAAASGSVRVETRSGRWAIDESGYALVLEPAGARLTVVSRSHIPVFAARAARRRDTGRLLEARVPIARARVALLAAELIAGARERAKEGAPVDPLDPRLDEPEATSEEPWPRLRVAVQGEPARRSARRGAFAELARFLLDDLGAEQGLSDPLDRDAALRRLLPELRGTPEDAARAAFLLGDAAFLEAAPALAKLEIEEARDARAKIAARWGPDARAKLVALSTRGASWDVRAWARERVDRSAWIAALLDAKDAPEEALVEALGAMESTDDPKGEKVAPLLDDARLLVRAEAAAALLRVTGSSRGRAVLGALAGSSAATEEVRETAIARLAAALPPTELGSVLAPIVADPDAPPSVRAQAARSLDQGEAVSATGALIEALDGELGRKSPDEARHDLRLALVAALATVATKAVTLGSGADEALRALGRAAAADPEEDVRALAIHAAGALPGPIGDQVVKGAVESEAKRSPPSRLALHAADLEMATRAPEEAARLVAIADSVCEAPVRSTLERLAKAARGPAARALLVERLKARGADGEVGLQLLERR